MAMHCARVLLFSYGKFTTNSNKNIQEIRVSLKYTLLDPNRDQLGKMQPQGLPAGYRIRVLWITRPVNSEN